MSEEPFVTPLDEKSEELRSIVEPAIEGQGCELVELVLVRGNRSSTVRLFVDAQGPESITLKQLERINRVLGDLLDVEDEHRGLFRGPYHLEVSSPGVDRPLAKRSHFEAALGEKVKIKTRVKVGGGRAHTGTLAAVDDQGFTLQHGEDELRVRFDELDRAHMVFQFPGASPKGERKRKKKSK